MARKKMERDMKVLDKTKYLAHQSGVDSTSTLVQNGMSPESIKELDTLRKIDTSGKNSVSSLTKELFDQYKEKIENGEKNELEKYIMNNIIPIRRLIDNIIKYSDPRVFEVVPGEFLKIAKEQGWVAQLYFDKILVKFANQKIMAIPPHYLQCRCCHKYRRPQLFFKVASDITDGYSIICKECANKLLTKYLKKYKDIREVLILISHKLDLYVYEPVLKKYCDYYEEEAGKQDIENGYFLGKYIADLNLERHYYPEIEKYTFENSRLDGVPFKCIENPLPVPPIYHDKFEVEVIKEVNPLQDILEDDDTQLSESLAKKLEYKFGKYPHSDLKWLERRYKEWEDVYDISQLNAQKLIIQMCCDELLITRQREQGIDVSKQFKTFRETMKDLNLTPKQQAKDSNSNMFNSVSDFIKEVEKHKPIVVRSKEFDDVDGIMRYVIGVSGAMARTIGKPNELTEMFDKMYKDYTLDILDVNESSDDFNLEEVLAYGEDEEQSE